MIRVKFKWINLITHEKSYFKQSFQTWEEIIRYIKTTMERDIVYLGELNFYNDPERF